MQYDLPKQTRKEDDGATGLQVSENKKLALIEVADEMRLKPAALTGIVMDSFIKARAGHGNRPAWPSEPTFRPGLTQEMFFLEYSCRFI